MTYPKEVLDALKRDHGVTFSDTRNADPRLCYGATCTWFGSIHETKVKDGGLPCCPHCSGVLLEMQSEDEWWSGVDRYEREKPHPGYRAMFEWQRAQKKCFPLRNGIDALVAAYSSVGEGPAL